MPPVYILNLPSSPAMTTKTVKGPGYQLGLFSDYSSHDTEILIKIKEKEGGRLEIFTSDDQLCLKISCQDKDSKVMYDNQGDVVLNIRNRSLSFGGEYQVFEGESDRLLLLTAKNKMTFGGPRMAASFKNFDENPVELQIRGKILSNKGKILLDDLPIARFEAGLLASADDGLSEPEIISRMAVAPLVDVAMVVTLFVCLQDVSSNN